MKRKRLTQVFPFLLPIRKWQRKKLFYLEMLIDGNKYAKNKSEALLPNTIFETSSLMLNENSGFDMKYQINKVHNLKLAARTINKVITAACFIAEVLIMGNENYIQNPELQNEQMKDENEVFNSFINVMVQIVEKYGKTVLQELDCAA